MLYHQFIYQLSWREQVIHPLCTRPTHLQMGFNSSVIPLKQQYVCTHMSLHSDTILIPSQPCQSLFLFLTAAHLAKNQQILNFIVFGLTDRDPNPQPITPETSMLNNTSPMRFCYHGVLCLC